MIKLFYQQTVLFYSFMTASQSHMPFIYGQDHLSAPFPLVALWLTWESAVKIRPFSYGLQHVTYRAVNELTESPEVAELLLRQNLEVCRLQMFLGGKTNLTNLEEWKHFQSTTCTYSENQHFLAKICEKNVLKKRYEAKL